MRHATLLVLPAALALAACQPQSTADQAATPAADPPPAEEAVAAPAEPAPAPAAARASLAPTEGSSVAGKVEFTAVDGGIRVAGEITGLPAGGQHGFHVHENGDCSAPDGTSAGGHFNPASSAHGRVGEGEHHAGDSDNLSANDQGVAAVAASVDGVVEAPASSWRSPQAARARAIEAASRVMGMVRMGGTPS